MTKTIKSLDRKPWFGGGWFIDFTLIDRIIREFYRNRSREKPPLFALKELAKRVGIGVPKMECFALMLRFMNLTIQTKGNLILTEFGNLYPNFKGRFTICKREIALYELVKNNRFYNWLFNDYLPLINVSGSSIKKSSVQTEFLSKFSKDLKGSERKFGEQLPSLLITLHHPRGFGRLAMFHQEETNTISYNPHVPAIETVAFVLTDFILQNSLPHITTDHYDNRNFLKNLFLLSNPKIEELMTRLVSKNVIVIENFAGLHQFGMLPEYLGKPFQFLRETLTKASEM